MAPACELEPVRMLLLVETPVPLLEEPDVAGDGQGRNQYDDPYK